MHAMEQTELDWNLGSVPVSPVTWCPNWKDEISYMMTPVLTWTS